MSTAIVVVTVVLHSALAVSVFFFLRSRSRRSKSTKVSPRIISVERLMAVGGFSNQRDMVDDALNFYEDMTEQAMKGNLVGYMDKDGQFTQVLTEGMKWAKAVGRVTGTGEAT